MKTVYLDAEFNQTREPRLNVVSIAYQRYDEGVLVDSKAFWIADPDHLHQARLDFIAMSRQGVTFIAFSVESEARALRSIVPEVDWVTERWVDLYLEYRCLLNGNNKLAYGEQYIKGRVIFTTPPPNKWDQVDEDESEEHHKPEYSLAAATYKLLGQKIDTEEKTRVRNIIIKGGDLSRHREDICSYNLSDIVSLRDLLLVIIKKYLELGVNRRVFFHQALTKGRFGALTAWMIDTGYPINRARVETFVGHIKSILEEHKDDCRRELPGCFRDTGQLTQRVVVEWIKAQGTPRWRQTDKGSVSISKDAFGEWYDSQSPGFAGAYCRYLKTKQSLNGFLPGSKKNFWDFVGSDDRVRPFLGIYGSQTSRSQPGSAAFIPLKAHWMRNFIEPPRGRAIVEIDYSSQEFLIAAIVSQDYAMMEAYASGDVYLAFAKACEMVPKNATKETHKKERDDCKAAVLGMSYEMGALSLSFKLTKDTGREWTEAEAQKFIDLFADSYPDYAEWKVRSYRDYHEQACVILDDGWTMWGDNPNRRSILNMPIQGSGAQIMREAVYLCYQAGLKVIMTLHDALFIEIDYWDLASMRRFDDAMIQAFHNVMSTYGDAPAIRTEGIAWSRHYADFSVRQVDKISLLAEYRTTKCERDLERFKKYFTAPQV